MNKKSTEEDWNEQEQIPDLGIDDVSHEPIDDKDVTVVLLNMGGPKTNDDVIDFQKRLFSDPLLIRFPLSKILQSLFAWILVKYRGEAAKKRYQVMGGGSPIYPSTEAQRDALQTELKKRGRDIDVIYSFNYSSPFPEETIKTIKQSQKKHVLPVSLYPHYSKATTGSNMFYLKKYAQLIYPELKFLSAQGYHLDESFVNAFVDRIHEQIAPGESLDDFYLIFSAHGLPLYFLTEGDPYPFQIAQTVGSIIHTLKRKERWVTCYQSSVGPMEWMKPSTDSILTALSRKGVKKVLVVPIAFVSDHIETVLEIDIEYRKFAEDLGVTDFRMSQALECHPEFIRALADSVEASLPAKRSQESLKETQSTGV